MTNSVCAITRFVIPSAASSATRRSLGVSDSTPDSAMRRGREPVATSSSRPCGKRSAPQRVASSMPLRSSSRPRAAAAAAHDRAEVGQRPGVLQPRAGALEHGDGLGQQRLGRPVRRDERLGSQRDAERAGRAEAARRSSSSASERASASCRRARAATIAASERHGTTAGFIAPQP